uniref:Uncharacterized protein n=1 Tax=Oryza brachyantha TaxID=4533 RepID=J3LQ31_ORYBR
MTKAIKWWRRSSGAVVQHRSSGVELEQNGSCGVYMVMMAAIGRWQRRISQLGQDSAGPARVHKKTMLIT